MSAPRAVTLSRQTGAYLDEVERFAARQFRYRQEIGMLIESARDLSSPALGQAFHELIFLAKFASGARAILGRAGTGGEDTAKLSAELSAALGKIVPLLELLFAHAPGERPELSGRRFLERSHDGLESLFLLLVELSWVKNHQLDHPGEFPLAPPGL